MQSLSTVVQSPLFSWLAAALCGLVLFIFFWWRAGSFFGLLDSFWRLITGKADLHDPTLNSLLQESLDLEKFQLIFGVKAETIADLHRFATWRKANCVGMTNIHKARRWIDVTSTEMVRKPPKNYVRYRLLIVVLASLCIVSIGQLAASRYAYLQMRDSKVWFKTDATTVKAPFEDWSFDQSKCASDRPEVMRLTGFNASETDVICEALEQDSLKALVTNTVKKQGSTGGVLVLIAFVFMLTNFYSALGAEEALVLRKRMQQHQDQSMRSHREVTVIEEGCHRIAKAVADLT